MNKELIGYMCGVSWQHEVGGTKVRVYPSASSCEHHEKCTHECGIVEIKLSFVKWVKDQNIGH